MAVTKNYTNWIIIGLLGLIVLSVAGMIYFYNQSMNEPTTNEPADVVLQDYQKLEKSYEKTINKLEKASKGDFSNVDILKKNLSGILQDIKKEKQKMDSLRKHHKEQFAEAREKKTEKLEERLEMSKEVADQYLKERLEKVKKEKKSLEQENKQLSEEKQQIRQSVKKIKQQYESQKAKNARLNATVEHIDNQMDSLARTEDNQEEKLKQLQQQKQQYEKKLDRSNNVIDNQSNQINTLTKNLKKVNPDCYFYYHKGDPEREAKIFLTNNGVSKRYKNYFIEEHPDIFTSFQLNKNFFEEGFQKIELKVLNNNDVNIFTKEKVIEDSELNIKIPSNRLEPDKKYYISVKQGDENLVVDGKYEFKI